MADEKWGELSDITHHGGDPLSPEENAHCRRMMAEYDANQKTMRDMQKALEELERYRWLWRIIRKTMAWVAGLAAFTAVVKTLFKPQ